MKLRIGDSVWLEQAAASGGGHASDIIAFPGHGPLTGNASCEVAIIGAGITAALVGQALAVAGVNVLAVDRRMPGGGSTTASTGLIQYELDTTLLELIARRGRRHAMEAYRVCGRAVREFSDHLQACGIDDAPLLTHHESLYLASHSNELQTFDLEAQARRHCDIDARVVEASELRSSFHLDRPAGILSAASLAIDPLAVTVALWRCAIADGLRLHTPCTIEDYEAHSDHVILRTGEGCHIKARRVVFATGYETPSFLDVDVQLNVTYAMAARTNVCRPGRCGDALVWESARPYLYMRPGPHGSLIVGGEDDPWTGQLPGWDHIQRKVRKLTEKSQRLHPQPGIEATHAWAGVFGQTADGLPYIGATRQYPLGYFALGYGGNGILFSFLAARIIRQHYMRSPCPEAWLFRFDR